MRTNTDEPDARDARVIQGREDERTTDLPVPGELLTRVDDAVVIAVGRAAQSGRGVE